MHNWHFPVTGLKVGKFFFQNFPFHFWASSRLLFSPVVGWEGCWIFGIFGLHACFMLIVSLFKIFCQSYVLLLGRLPPPDCMPLGGGNFFDQKFFLTKNFLTKIFLNQKRFFCQKICFTQFYLAQFFLTKHFVDQRLWLTINFRWSNFFLPHPPP